MLIFSGESLPAGSIQSFVFLMHFSALPPHFLLSFLSSYPLHPFSSSVEYISEYVYDYDMLTLLEMVSNCFSFVFISVKCNKNISIPEITIYVGRHISWVEEERDDRISLSLILQRYF